MNVPPGGTPDPLRQLEENIEAMMRSGQQMRRVLERFAHAQGLTVEEVERRVEVAQERLFPGSTALAGVITVRKIRVGWTVDGRWCPTQKIRDHQIRRVRERTGKTNVRTPGRP